MNKYDFKLMGNTIMNYEGPDYDGKEGDEGRNGLYNFPDDPSKATIKSEHSGERKIVVKEIDNDDFADSVIQELNDELILKDLIIKDLENSIDKTCKEGTTCYAKISQLRVENVDLIYKNHTLKQEIEREEKINKNYHMFLEELELKNESLTGQLNLYKMENKSLRRND